MYTIKEAAHRTGVSVPLLRAWERRYGIVRPIRTSSGYRLYDEPSIERVRAMRRLVEAGWSASQAARQIEAEVIPPDVSHRISRGEETEPGAASGHDDVAEAFVDAAAVMDAGRLEGVLDDLFSGGTFERVVEQRLMPALRALGAAWAAGTLSVGGEHAASHAVIRRLSAAYEAAARDASRDRPVVVGLPPGSRHEIGALAFATAARRRGIGVIYLGADVPLDSWIETARTTNARAIVVAIPTEADRATAESVAAAVGRVRGTLVAIGGPGAADATVPSSVLRLPAEIGPAAEALDIALARSTGSQSALASARSRRR